VIRRQHGPWAGTIRAERAGQHDAAASRFAGLAGSLHTPPPSTDRIAFHSVHPMPMPIGRVVGARAALAHRFTA
jgi:hypothetical protein